MKKTLKDIQHILNEAKTKLQKIYKNKLKQVILYGSYARGDADEGSDIDIVIIFENISDPVYELEKCSNEIHKLDFFTIQSFA